MQVTRIIWGWYVSCIFQGHGFSFYTIDATMPHPHPVEYISYIATPVFHLKSNICDIIMLAHSEDTWPDIMSHWSYIKEGMCIISKSDQRTMYLCVSWQLLHSMGERNFVITLKCFICSYLCIYQLQSNNNRRSCHLLSDFGRLFTSIVLSTNPGQ